MTRMDIVAMCQKHEIALEAWGPLVRGLRFKHPSISGLARKYGKQPAQILLRYSIQKASLNWHWRMVQRLISQYYQGYIPIPKASSIERIIANTQIYDFELSEEEMCHLNSLDEGTSA